jgi:hypothetical protein
MYPCVRDLSVRTSLPETTELGVASKHQCQLLMHRVCQRHACILKSLQNMVLEMDHKQ